MRIGFISDTHGKLPASVFSALKDVEHIFHAGDIGNRDVIIELETISPVSAVSGNIDMWEILTHYSHELTISLDDVQVYMRHDIGNARDFNYRLFKENRSPDVVVFGHTHRPYIHRHGSILYINPGSASQPRHRVNGTVAILDTSIRPLTAELIDI
jgi:putative phosphoesterase